MLRYTKIIGLAAVLAVAVTGTTVADGHLAKAVKARQALMQVYSFNLGNLGAMAKGKAAYNAEAAANFANNLAAAAAMKNGAMWPKGTDNVALGTTTRAKPEIWSTYPKVAEASKALVAASAAMAKVAGNGLEALQGSIGDVGKSCGGCHKPFRAKKK